MKNPQLWSQFVATFPELLQAISPHHHSIAEHLITSSWEDISNIMIYGSVGFPYQLFVDFILSSKFGKTIKKECIFSKSLTYYETPHYFELDIMHPNNQKALDELLDFVKHITSSSCINVESRHIIILHNIDAIKDKYAFRVLLERFSKNAMFIGVTTKLCAIDPPIRSRFYLIRTRLFEITEITHLMELLGVNHVPTDRNVIRQIAMATDPLINSKYYFPPMKDFFDKHPNPSTEEIRALAFKACQHNVPISNIVIDLLQHVPDDKQYWFISNAATIEHQLACTNRGRQPLYYEYLFQAVLYGRSVKNKM